VNRRHFLATAVGAGASAGFLTGCRRSGARRARAGVAGRADEAFLDELSRASFRYFVEAAHPRTGQVLDRRRADGGEDRRGIASIAATGFGLTALAVAEVRGWLPAGAAQAQARRALRHLRHEMRHERGFYYHFHDWGTGERVWRCELSSIDTAILMCGVLACRAQFGNGEIGDLATEVFERVEWPWMLAGGATFSMGWSPERGFLESRWDHYCELMLLYLLALGSPTHPVDPASWRAWSRPIREFYGERFVWSPAPLFVHQFSQAWFDFRGRWDAGVDWFENSAAATRAHLNWSLDRAGRFPRWSPDLWGVTSSDSERGYVGWGGPPDSGPLDGTIVPCAAAGSLPFLPDACLRTLHFQRERYGDRVWGPYGFVDAFNPHTGWVNPDVIGIDLGITLLMAENARSGIVWELLRRDPVVRDGLARAGVALAPRAH
jgi:hypothetical protein